MTFIDNQRRILFVQKDGKMYAIKFTTIAQDGGVTFHITGMKLVSNDLDVSGYNVPAPKLAKSILIALSNLTLAFIPEADKIKQKQEST